MQWKESGVLVHMVSWEAGLPLKQWGSIDQCCVRPVLLYCRETWELTVVDEAVLNGVECCMIRMCGLRLVDRVLNDVLCDRVGFVVKTEDMIIQSRLQWYGHDMCGGINSQICEVMKVQTTGKRK